MPYLKIHSYIFTIDLCEDSISDENKYFYIDDPDKLTNALYTMKNFKILDYTHITGINNQMKDADFIEILKYLFFKQKNIENDLILDFAKEMFNIHEPKDLINLQINKKICYFKSYERAFNYRFIFDKQYLLFENGYSGIYKNWNGEGTLVTEYFHVNGVKNGKVFFNGNIYEFCNDINKTGGISSDEIDALDHYNYDYE